MAAQDSQQKLKEYLEDILTRNEYDNAIETAETEIPLQDLIKITNNTTVKQMKEIIIQNNNLLEKYENAGLRKYLLQAENVVKIEARFTKKPDYFSFLKECGLSTQ